ncbi:MAG: DUF6152 family protein [Rhodospirillaceae bacterium]|nr:DUF6152 family protein [Rhodospirillaceae bacterium]
MNTSSYTSPIPASLRRWAICAVLLLAPAFLAEDAFAHHSVPVNFDTEREISVSGALTEIKWLNPHSYFRMDVTNDDGSTVEWLVEMGAINTMRRAGFQTDRFSLGQLVTITGWPGRRDRVVYLNRALIEDGTELLCLGARCNLTEED